MLPKVAKSLRLILGSGYTAFGLALFVIVGYIALYIEPSTRGRFYWVFVDCSYCAVDIIVDFVPLIALVMVFLWIFRRVRMGRKLPKFLWPPILLLMCPLVFFAAGALPSAGFRHLDEVYVGGKLWRLAFWDSGGSSGAKYGLFQCDSLGINCDEVHFIDIYKLSDKSSPELIIDSQQQYIVVQNSGGELYKHEY